MEDFGNWFTSNWIYRHLYPFRSSWSSKWDMLFMQAWRHDGASSPVAVLVTKVAIWQVFLEKICMCPPMRQNYFRKWRSTHLWCRIWPCVWVCQIWHITQAYRYVLKHEMFKPMDFQLRLIVLIWQEAGATIIVNFFFWIFDPLKSHWLSLVSIRMQAGAESRGCPAPAQFQIFALVVLFFRSIRIM